MTSTADDVIIREALPGDFDDIMAIGDVYGGRDYLFALYHELVGDPGTYCVVAVIGGRAVGFYCLSTVDGGRAVIKRTARVHTHFRGRGIFKLLEQEIHRYMETLPGSVRYEYLAKSSKLDHLAGSLGSKGYVEIYRKDIVHMILKPSKLIQPPVQQEVSGQLCCYKPEVIRLTSDDLKLMFQSRDFISQMFPKGRLFNFYLGYRLIEDNIALLLCERGGVFASLETGQFSREITSQNNNNNYDTKIHDLSSESDKLTNVAMITFYYCFPTTTGFLYFLDVYARPEIRHRSHFREHLQLSLKSLQSIFPGKDGLLSVTVDSSIPLTDVTSCLNEVGVVDILPGQADQQVLYERILRPSV